MKLVVSLFLTLLLFACSSEKYDLGLNLKESETYTQNYASVVKVIMDENGKKLSQNFDITGTLKFKVLKEHNDFYEMEVRYDKIIWRIYYSNGMFEYNSEKKKPDDVVSQILKNITKKTFQIKLTKKGRVSEINGLNVLIDSTIAQSMDLTDENIETMKSELKLSMGEDVMKANFEIASAIFPDKSVSTSDTWKILLEIDGDSPKEIETEYRLTNVAQMSYRLSGKSKISYPIKKYHNIDGMEIKYDLTGSATSTILIDKETGWIIEANVEQNYSGKAHVRANYYSPGGLFPMTISQKFSYSN